jgi:hypothetical protein
VHPDYEKVFEDVAAIESELGIPVGVLVVPGWYVTTGETFFLTPYNGRIMVLRWNSPTARDTIAAQLEMTVVTG